jgi:hypothetical protein
MITYHTKALQEVDRLEEEKHIEFPVVQLPNTAAHPKAVMVVFPHAPLALLAVLGPIRLLFGTIITEPPLGKL